MAVLSSLNAQAQSPDILGGPDAAAQTIAHCGMLPASQKNYTSSAATTRIIQTKLSMLGYYHATPSGTYDKASKKAVKRFQREYGLKSDGVVGPMTAQRLAYETYPSANVRRCFHMAGN